MTMLILVANVAVADGTGRECLWWLEPHVQRELMLTGEQVRAIESGYRRTLAHRRVLRKRLDAATAELTRAFARDDLSDIEAQALVNQVEDWRRRRNVARTRLLVALYFVLTSEQRVRFSHLVDGGAITVPPRC
jgi:Spy/CpxP family protein refolding chaperone